jgi:hypothetical protein
MNTAATCKVRKQVVNSVIFSPVYSPPDKLADYIEMAKKIISENDPATKVGISPKSRRALINLQRKLRIGQFFIKNREKKQ